jgi:hypothetical protein
VLKRKNASPCFARSASTEPTFENFAISAGFVSVLRLTAIASPGPPQYLWTWNGDSGLFQGSFETSADETQPGAVVLNGLFNLSITSPTGVWISNLGTGDHTLFQYINSYTYGITVFDPSGEELVATSMGMSEQLGNATLFGETGTWSITEIPEPSIVGLVGAAAACLFMQNRVRQNSKST